MNDKLLVVIGGPTASGKTALALALAARWGTEIISADSRQLYREMTIGTAKPTPAELRQVPHHFIDSHSIVQPCSAGEYGEQARAKIEELFFRHNRLIVCGGSGLYLRALLEGFDDLPDIPESVRQRFNEDYEKQGLAWLQAEVQRRDPQFYVQAEILNPRRLLRALELMEVSGLPMAAMRKQDLKPVTWQVQKIGLSPARELLYQRIDQRVDQMVADGLFEEAQSLLPWRHQQALQTVGYEEPFGYFDGAYDRAEAIRLIKRNTRHYAKRQLTWFRRDLEMTWYDGPSAAERVLLST